jgi:hypothetical protein
MIRDNSAEQATVKAESRPDTLRCYESCNSIDIETARNAVNAFCSTFPNLQLSQISAPGFSPGVAASVGDSDPTAMEIIAVKADTCPETIAISEAMCMESFMVPVTNCSQLGKRGGFWITECLSWHFNPHPNGCSV